MFSSACRKKKHAAPPLSPRINSIETGIASWYGYPYHGRRAANGEIYDMEKLTAAHRTLPFGTWLEVTNLDNGKNVNVRVTDRGPFVDGRIIDLSKAAARNIDMIGPGVAKVRLRVIEQPADAPVTALFAVQAGAFADKTRAETLRSRFADEYGNAELVLRPGNPSVWRVLVGKARTIEEADQIRMRIQSAGHPAFVVRLDDPAVQTH